MEKTLFTRQELYNLVWTEPISRLSEKLNIKDSTLRKICHNSNIPLPDASYWGKFKFNKPVIKKELPEDNSVPNEINISQSEQIVEDYSTEYFLRIYKSLNKDLFKVPLKLSSPDSLTTAAYKKLLDPNSRYSRDGMIFPGSGFLDIKVFPQSLERAIRIFDTVIKFLKYRGYNIKLNGDETIVVIKEINVQIALREKQNFEYIQEKYGTTKRPYSSGLLVFKVRCLGMREYYDNSTTIEEKLPQIFATIEYKGYELRRIWDENDLKRQKEDEEKKIIQEKADRIKKELLDFKDLLKEANDWNQSVILNNYLTAAEKNARNTGNYNQNFEEWLTWAKKKAEWFNPLINGDDDILEDRENYF